LSDVWEELKDKGDWVHTPSGLRPPRATDSPLQAIPQVRVPIAKSDTAEPKPAVEDALLQAALEAPPIPAWLVKEMSFGFKAGLAVLFLFGVIGAFKVGEWRGRKSALGATVPATASARAGAEFPEDLLPSLDAALVLLREGKNLEALEALKKLIASNPTAPSLQYATAIAALQAGYPLEADRLAEASIKSGSRVSDSWALKAAIASVRSRGGAAAERENLLKHAITSDPMNPAPFLEMASLLRAQGKSALAAALLESAASRLNPSDAATVIDTTRAILAVDATQELLPLSEPLGIPAKDIPNAYSELMRGNFENAAAILRFCRDQTNPDLFAYLVNDPALRKFSARPELKEFY
jgi:tetratricopeptide (TPR) repeat protein